MLTQLIPVFAVFAVVYLAVAIVLDGRRARLARQREIEREAERDAQRATEHPRRSFFAPQVGQPYEPTAQETAWLNTWLH